MVPTILKALSITCIIAAAATTAVADQRYSFTLIAQCNMMEGCSIGQFGPPAINNAGTVAFKASESGGGEGIFAGDGGPIRAIATASSLGAVFLMGTSDPSINDTGTVAFQTDIFDGTGFTSGIFTGSGGPVAHIVDPATGPVEFLSFGVTPVINNSGTVAFEAALDLQPGQQDFVHGIFTSDGGALTTIVDSTHGFPVSFVQPEINNHGEVAFQSIRVDSATGQTFIGVYKGRGGPVTTVAECPEFDCPVFFATGTAPVSINDPGTVAFFADTNEGGMFARGIFTGNGGPLTPVVLSSEFTDPIFFMEPAAPAINNRGTVAFFADGMFDQPDGTLLPKTGIFTGPNPVENAVIVRGDPLFGAHVEFFQISGFGGPIAPVINDRGQIAFVAHLDDGREVLVRADPGAGGSLAN